MAEYEVNMNVLVRDADSENDACEQVASVVRRAGHEVVNSSATIDPEEEKNRG